MGKLALLSNLFDLAVPQSCVVCRRRIDNWVCDRCKLLFRPGHRWEDHESAQIHQFAAVWRYEAGIRLAFEQWKFHALPGLGDRMIRSGFSDEWLAEVVPSDIGAIVPIPPHSFHRRQRGFDPVAQIADYLSSNRSLPIWRGLIRLRRSRPQVTSDQSERRENVKNAFGVKGQVPDVVLLVDDVTTTGATLNEAATTLRNHGASKVAAIVLAAVPPKSEARK